MGSNGNENIQATGELTVISLNILGDVLSALGSTQELLEQGDSTNPEKLEVLGSWIVVIADIIELWLLLREQDESDTLTAAES